LPERDLESGAVELSSEIMAASDRRCPVSATGQPLPLSATNSASNQGAVSRPSTCLSPLPRLRRRWENSLPAIPHIAGTIPTLAHPQFCSENWDKWLKDSAHGRDKVTATQFWKFLLVLLLTRANRLLH